MQSFQIWDCAEYSGDICRVVKIEQVQLYHHAGQAGQPRDRLVVPRDRLVPADVKVGELGQARKALHDSCIIQVDTPQAAQVGKVGQLRQQIRPGKLKAVVAAQGVQVGCRPQRRK